MPFNSALSGLRASNSELRVRGNNIANASTNGFKKSRAEFSDVVAAGALGSSANTIGTGVKIGSVTQQFTQGVINTAETNLDLSINGSGLFVLDDSGSRIYSRAGAFRVDKDGFIANSQRQKLVGFLTDSNGNITGAQGNLQIQNSSLDPSASNTINVTLNLDASVNPPSQDFVSGFVPGTPPASTTFNNSASTTIYDSLGNSHVMTMYFVKAPAERTWQMHVGIDGTDVTPTSAAVPAGGTPGSPASYAAGQLAKPFTMVFDTSGQLVANNPASPAQHYGNPPVNSTDNTAALVNSGTLSTLDIGDLTINGVPISVSNVTDSSSTSDAAASSITIVDAINATTTKHKVTATKLGTTLDFTAGTYTTNALAAGDFSINGVQIVGSPATADAAGLANLINSIGGSGVPGVTASNNAGQLRLVASDGRNIQVQSDGITASGIAFSNFDLNNGAPLDQVKRGQFSLNITGNRGITVGGSAPTDVGLTAGVLAGIFQNNSDTISIPNFNPGTGAVSPQPLTVSLSSSTQFSSPFAITALTQDGYPTGRLTGVEVDPEGVITARYGNGKSLQLGQVALANFRNPSGLQPLGDTSWAETFASGVALLGAPGTSDLGLISSGSLEDSNVALTDELVGLIVAQRNFQASAQTIRTADAVTQTIINIR